MEESSSNYTYLILFGEVSIIFYFSIMSIFSFLGYNWFVKVSLISSQSLKFSSNYGSNYPNVYWSLKSIKFSETSSKFLPAS